jgi:hypothetical protein
MTEARLVAEEGVIHARWGALPNGVTYDPSVLEPVSHPSWILDLDMFTDQQTDFDREELCLRASLFAQRIYAVFREMVTKEFLLFYGGKP